jgi:hypothetical protein
VGLAAVATLTAGVVAAVLRTMAHDEIASCDFGQLGARGATVVEGEDFRVSLPAGWVSIDPNRPDRDAQIDRVAGGQDQLSAFLTATSRAVPAGARLIGALRADPFAGNLLLESPGVHLSLDSEHFDEFLRYEVESEGFRIRSLDVCEFRHPDGEARFVSYGLVDSDDGTPLETRAAFVEAGASLWALSSFGGDGPRLDDILVPIVMSFRAQATP